MQRRIFGIENEYGVTCTLRGQRRLSPDEVARYLFRRVVSWGRSSNVFLANGARLYLDVGSHPEYATPEWTACVNSSCTTRQGSGSSNSSSPGRAAPRRRRRARRRLPVQEQHRLRREQLRLPRELLHEPPRRFFVVHRGAHPLLVSRQIYAGAGKVLQTAGRDIASASEPSTSGRASARRPREAARSSTPATNLMPMRSATAGST